MRVIQLGDLYWVSIAAADGTAGIPHPHIVLQATVLNQSRLETTVVCAVTTNRRRASYPGNVLLEVGEGGLPKLSVVEVSKVSAIAKSQLGAYIGQLSEQRVQQIFAGMRLLHLSFHDA